MPVRKLCKIRFKSFCDIFHFFNSLILKHQLIKRNKKISSKIFKIIKIDSFRTDTSYEKRTFGKFNEPLYSGTITLVKIIPILMRINQVKTQNK